MSLNPKFDVSYNASKIDTAGSAQGIKKKEKSTAYVTSD
jgi:hypothetical protein